MSKLRSDELVNMEGDGAPSFPQGATTIEPTADDQVATKLYVDSTLSAASGNAVSATAPINPAVGSFWTDTSVSPSLLKTWNGSMWIEFAGTAGAAVGVVVSLPSLSATNLEHAPATITASAAQVSGATLFITKWYKDDVEIVGATGSTYVATEPGVYRYEERWADNAGNILTPSLNKTIELLTIETPSIIIPVADTGLPDFEYTAESSPIANIGTVDALGNEDAFSVYLQSSTSNQPLNIGNGLDFATHGGLIWLKSRNTSGTFGSNVFIDTERGANEAIIVPGTNPSQVITGAPSASSFDSNGFTWGSEDNFHPSGRNYASWSFLKSSGFFDIVTWTGDGTSNRQIPHNLGSAPGMIMVKMISDNDGWNVYHKDAGETHYLNLNSTGPAVASSTRWNDTAPTDSVFTIGNDNGVNQTGKNFIAYLFADNPSNEIKCGTFSNNTGNWDAPASEDATIDCGFEPQFIITKLATRPTDPSWSNLGGGWYVMDSTRGWGTGLNQSIQTNETNEEATEGNYNFTPTSTGFVVTKVSPGDHVYLAIGSPKIVASNTQLTLTDTAVSKISDGSLVSGTSIDQALTVGETVQADTIVTSTTTVPVFSTTLYSGNNQSNRTITTGVDNTGTDALVWIKSRNNTTYPNHWLTDTKRGAEYQLSTNSHYGQQGPYTNDLSEFLSDGFKINFNGRMNNSGTNYVAWNFRTAPGFFDIVTYTGDGNYNRTIPHQLGSEPGMIIIKSLNASYNWPVYHTSRKGEAEGLLDSDQYFTWGANTWFMHDSMSADSFGVTSQNECNQNGRQYVAYVFGNTSGKIDCGSYYGTNNSSGPIVNCGFRPAWVMIKQSTHSGGWFMFDGTRGYATTGNSDAKLIFAESSNAETTDWGITIRNDGFQVNDGGSSMNRNGATVVYVAIAENAEADITSSTYASGTVSASSGNMITLSDVSGTWSTGMKVQGVTSDIKDYPDPIDASAVTFTSSQPAVTSGTVNTWDYAEWNLSHDSAFSGVVHQKAVPLTGTGTQAGPDDFTIQSGTEYFVRTKYASSLPSGQSDWSAVTRFLTKAMLYADDVFSTYLYEGNSSELSINNGINLAGEGGMVWIKRRQGDGGKHVLFDTERGATKRLYLETDAESTASGSLTSFNNNGFTVGSYGYENNNGLNHVAWTFRKAPGFFDIVTYTGNGGSSQTIPHNLDSVPGFIMVKELNNTSNWICYHRNLGNDYAIYLNNTEVADGPNKPSWNQTSPTSTEFTVGTDGYHTNDGGTNYIAYLFAHDDARFGTNGDESIIKCGSYTGNGSSDGPEIDLGFEPQFLLYKNITQATNWEVIDTMRGMPNTSGEHNGYMTLLRPNDDNVEGTDFSTYPTSTGFKITNAGASNNGTNNTYIYIAIRRPHKPPTLGTQVFMPISRLGTSSNTAITNVGFAPDTHFGKILSNGNTYQNLWFDKLIGPGTYVKPTETAQANTSSNIQLSFDQDGVTVGEGNNVNGSGQTYINYFFKRAPGFYDMVVYPGTGSTQQVNHNLGVTPELMIVKQRDATTNWPVYAGPIPNSSTSMLFLNGNNAAYTNVPHHWGSTDPTSTVFTVAGDAAVNQNGGVYSAYLFASQSGVSKVGTYTGTGSDINIDCGFTNGARFILIKRTDDFADWYVWDTARGITSGNDPYLLLNSTDAQVTNTDYIDPLNAGFTVTSSAPAALNETGGTYLFFAIS